MINIAESALALLKKSEAEARKLLKKESGPVSVAASSVHKLGEALVMIGQGTERRFLLVVADYPQVLPAGFEGELHRLSDGAALVGELSAANAAALRRHFPWTAPSSLHDCRTTIGCGDRLGLAGRGQLASIRKFKVKPVLAQQSKRELSMTNRSFQDVVDAACFSVFEADWREGWGADGDHLKTIADLEPALAAGMPMVTLDLSDQIVAAAAAGEDGEVSERFGDCDPAEQERIRSEYENQVFVVGESEVAVDGATARRCAVMYGAALDFAVKVFQYLKSKRGSDFDLELSFDETGVETVPAHHLFIARELRKRGVELASLAPCFPGEFQKGVDYRGNLAEFERQLRLHVRIAHAYGDYKLSIHSGSDKFSVFPIIGRETGGRFHLKTAGTSWLVAAGVIAAHEPALYREMHRCALENFGRMKQFYHITADPARIPALEAVADAALPELLELPEERQLMHISYGPILQGELGGRFFAAMHRFSKEYDAALERWFDRHLSLLGVGKRQCK